MASRAFLYGEGAFCVPPHRPFSHCTFFPPQVFFCGLRGQHPCWRACVEASCRMQRPDCNGMPHSERCSGNTPKCSVKPRCRNSPLTPFSGTFLCPKGKMLSVFFQGLFLETFPTILGFFQSSIRLSFSAQRIFGEELWIRGWGLCLANFSLKNASFFTQKPCESKVLPFLAFSFIRVLPFLRHVFGGFWGVNSDFVLVLFCGVVFVG